MQDKQKCLDKFLKKAHLKWGDKFDYSDADYKRNSIEIKITCNEHGSFMQTPYMHLKYGCSKCRRKEKFLKDAFIKHSNKFDYSLVKYENSHKKVKIICPFHGVIEQTPVAHLHHDCRKCHRAKPKSRPKCKNIPMLKSVFVKKAIDKHGARYDYSLLQEPLAKKVTILCKKHGPFSQQRKLHLKGRGCRQCSHESKTMSQEQFIKRATEKHNNKYDYSKSSYVRNSDKILITCKKHGDFYQTANLHLRGYGCPTCKSSKGEREIAAQLKKLSIKYISQATFDWGINSITGRKYKYDFFLVDHNCIIEYDGEQHVRPVQYGSNKEIINKRFKEYQRRDQEKERLAKENLIELYRILWLDYDNIDVRIGEILKTKQSSPILGPLPEYIP